MRVRRPAATAVLLVSVALTACMDSGSTVPDAGDQETPATQDDTADGVADS